MDSQTQLQTAWDEAKAGENTDGAIDCGDAYISYETEDIGNSRYFKLWVGRDDEYVDASPSQPVRDAVATALRVVPDADFLPESGEMYATIEV